MFTVVGILSILAGCFLFLYSYIIVSLFRFLNLLSEPGMTYMLVSFCLILGGAFSIASHDGQKRTFVVDSFLLFFGSFLISSLRIIYCDATLLIIISAVLFSAYLIWLFQHPAAIHEDENQPNTDEFSSADVKHNNTNNNA